MRLSCTCLVVKLRFGGEVGKFLPFELLFHALSALVALDLSVSGPTS